MSKLSGSLQMTVNETLQHAGFDWRSKKLDPNLSHTSKAQFVRDRNLAMAREAMLTEAKVASVYGTGVTIPNVYNQSEEELQVRHTWISLGQNSTAYTRFTTPERIQAVCKEFELIQAQNSMLVDPMQDDMSEDREISDVETNQQVHSDPIVISARRSARILENLERFKENAALKESSDSGPEWSDGSSGESWEEDADSDGQEDSDDDTRSGASDTAAKTKVIIWLDEVIQFMTSIT